MTDSKRPRAPKDIAILNGPTQDGQGARVVRIRQGEVSAGEIRPVREGEPINHSEVVRLRPLDAQQRVCEIEVLHAPGAEASTGDAEKQPSDGAEPSDAGPGPENRALEAGEKRKRHHTPGPARVSTPSYRKNWSTIFESKKDPKAPGSKTDWSVN